MGLQRVLRTTLTMYQWQRLLNGERKVIAFVQALLYHVYFYPYQSYILTLTGHLHVLLLLQVIYSYSHRPYSPTPYYSMQYSPTLTGHISFILKKGQRLCSNTLHYYLLTPAPREQSELSPYGTVHLPNGLLRPLSPRFPITLPEKAAAFCVGGACGCGCFLSAPLWACQPPSINKQRTLLR